MKRFYVQDSRSYVGNCMSFWAIGGGYTTNVAEAEIFTQKQAEMMHRHRDTDIMWSKEYIDSKVRPTVDMQDVKKSEDL